MEPTKTCLIKQPIFQPETKINIPWSMKIGRYTIKISTFGWFKVFTFITTLTFISYFINGHLAWDYTVWKPVKYKEYVVWHYGFTMAVLEFLGIERTLVNCRLILVETR